MNKRSRQIKWSHLVNKLLAQLWCVLLPIAVKSFIMLVIVAQMLITFGFIQTPMTLKQLKPITVSAQAKARPSSDVAISWSTLYCGGTHAACTYHYEAVDESVPDDDNSYISNSAGANVIDRFGLADDLVPAGSNVTGISIASRVRDTSGALVDTYRLLYNIGAGNVVGTTQNTTNGYTNYTETWTGLTWTATDVDNLTIGIEQVVGAALNNTRCTQLTVFVNYYAITVLSTDKASYPTLGETVAVSSTVRNGSGAPISGSTFESVIFIDTSGDGAPTAGETYITDGCAGSGVWASGNYTDTWSPADVAVEGTQADSWNCVNSNFPSNTTYTLYGKWYKGATTYDTASTTFSSIPTLDWYLFYTLIGLAVFLAYRQGYLQLGLTKIGLAKHSGKTNFLPSRKSQFEGKNLVWPKPNDGAGAKPSVRG